VGERQLCRFKALKRLWMLISMGFIKKDFSKMKVFEKFNQKNLLHLKGVFI
jgi:hypothetical protein